jgi:hypothetical protein
MSTEERYQRGPWAILLIALDVWVIWSVTRPGVVRT